MHAVFGYFVVFSHLCNLITVVVWIVSRIAYLFNFEVVFCMIITKL